MDFGLSDQQLRLCNSVREFAEQNLGANVTTRDASQEPSESAEWREDWRYCAEFGIFGLNIPEDYLGRGNDTLTTVLAMESLGYGCPDNGLTLAINGQIWAVQHPILQFGTEIQKQKYLPRLVDGSWIGAHGLTEEKSGSDAMSLETRAESRGDGYVLNGAKTLVGMGPACDVAIVFASTAPDLGKWGISAFLVEAGDNGFHRGPAEPKMGLQSVPTGNLAFEDCWVPADRLLGPEGAGASIFQDTMEWERCFIFSSHVGAMAKQLDICVDYAHQRQTFGRPIADNQSVSNRLADMRVRLDTARLLLHRAAWMKSSGQSAALEASVTKLHISEALVASGLDAIAIHGGVGYLPHTGIEHFLRDAIGGTIYSGTSDIQRQIIARLIH